MTHTEQQIAEGLGNGFQRNLEREEHNEVAHSTSIESIQPSGATGRPVGAGPLTNPILLTRGPSPIYAGDLRVHINHSGALRRLLAVVADVMAVDPELVVKGGKTAVLVAARTVFIWVARHHIEASYPQIAAALRIDHTTAIHHVVQCRNHALEYQTSVTRVLECMRARGA